MDGKHAAEDSVSVLTGPISGVSAELYLVSPERIASTGDGPLSLLNPRVSLPHPSADDKDD